MEKQLLKKVYLRYHREIFLYLLNLCGEEKTAEDLMQETFLKALLSLPDAHTNIRAWLYMVARNLWFDCCRRRKHETLREDPSDYAQGQARQVEEDVLEQVLRTERQKTLWQVLHTLPDRQKEVLLLQYFSGLSQKEIAAVMQISAENVRVLSYRGKRNLRMRLESEQEERRGGRK